MNINDVRACDEFAKRYGFKAIVYGPPGAGKTPILASTAPQAITVFHESGVGSLKGVKSAGFMANTVMLAEEFYKWFFESHEARVFNSLVIDSVSHLMNLYLEAEFAQGSKAGNEAHGMRAYGNAAKETMKHINKAYFRPDCHVFAIAKEEVVSYRGVDNYRRPSYPGKVLPVDMPHLFDNIIHLDKYHVPGVGLTTACRCLPGLDAMARDRFGKLAEFEQPNFTQIVNKSLAA